jgi:hypothetical protein
MYLACQDFSDEEFIAEAIRRAESEGLYRAVEQRPVDWERVREWARRCQQPGFLWKIDEDEIIVSANGAVCDGQHRVLGGLMGGNPPPYVRQGFYNGIKPWDDNDPVDLLDLLI